MIAIFINKDLIKNKMINLNKENVLIIPDVHQCGHFIKTILEKEKGNYSKIVFLGDYIDCFETPDGSIYYGISQMCEYLNELYEDLGDDAIWLVGNHDLAYLSTYVPNSTAIDKLSNGRYLCSGWTKSKASSFNKYINPKWVENLKLCCTINNKYLLSHAGFHYDQFKPYLNEKDNIEYFYNDWEEKKMTLSTVIDHWIGYVGSCRGGKEKVGSPVWLDWSYEFSGIDNYIQIVGHTSFDWHKLRIKNQNYCIDNYRQTYATIYNDKLNILSA